MKIEIITTPNEKLKETGFGTFKACHGVLDAINRMGYTAKLSVCETVSDLDKVIERKPNLVVLAVKYIPTGNNGNIWLADYFMKHEINFTGSLREVLEFDSNKVLAKSHLQSKGIATAKYFTAIPGQYNCKSELPIKFPLFLKPTDAANGNGIDDLSFVTSFPEFEAKILSLHELFRIPILVEEYLDGREFTVAVIRKSDGELIVSPIEIIPPESTNGLRILGGKVKNDNSEELKRIEDDEIKHRVKQLAINSFINLGVRDFGRIDIKANKDGKCFFIEANLVPGMTPGSSYFPKSCEIELGLTYEKVIQIILENGLSRAKSAVSPNQAIQI
ncbi:D-alanine--D-alanine ligase family protein [Moritella yayanosii]|uniref:D-alanine--D-alanine ligase n=1 Tax=Moritella yayanosii TaxID=69539 RepID=A0A330LSU5_9GAMM|nr:D-alanine--D-alanine ligase [Moritella yayanosii]SQD79920.1 D-alanine--D-alanine ligase [Moritella yayanosii]